MTAFTTNDLILRSLRDSGEMTPTECHLRTQGTSGDLRRFEMEH